MKFNYQAVFEINDCTKTIFVGTTELTPANLYLFIASNIDKMLGDVNSKCISFIYQPFKENENETQTQK